VRALFWIPIVSLVYFFCAWVTNKSTTSKDLVWFYLSWAVSAIPLWAIISRQSKCVVYDGLVFDITMTLSYTLAIIFFTKAFIKLSLTNYLGLGLIFFGIIMFKHNTL
jgi:hypothetical protein